MKYMSLFVKSSQEEDEGTKKLKAEARQEAKLSRSHDIERGEEDKVQHAINVELGIEVRNEEDYVGEYGDIGSNKRLSSTSDNDVDDNDINHKDPKISSSILPKKTSKSLPSHFL